MFGRAIDNELLNYSRDQRYWYHQKADEKM